METKLLKTLLSKNNYKANQARLKWSIFSGEAAELYDLLGMAHAKYDHDLIEDDLYSLWLADNPVATNTEKAGFMDLFDDVCDAILAKDETDRLCELVRDMKLIPGGRYLYNAGRPNKFFNNCYFLKAEEDTREDWADLWWKADSCLMIGGGIGVDYSVYRAAGTPIHRTGGQVSDPIPKMNMINEIGRRVMKDGSRRSAIYASWIGKRAISMSS